MPKQIKGEGGKSGINPLLIAGGTLLFYMAAIPLVDALSTWAQTAIGSRVAKIQYMMAQDQQETEEIADRINGSGCTQAIGFQIDSQEFDGSELDDE